MPALPIAQWQAALDQMETSLDVSLRTLDRGEERWELAVAPSAGEGEWPPALARLDIRLHEWEQRIRSADGLAHTVECELTSGTAAVEQWRARFANWDALIQQREAPLPVA